MKTAVALCVLALTVAGCAGKPVPDWQAGAQASVQAYVAAFLSGRDKVAAQELALARREVARTGDAEQMARVELNACAARLASLLDLDAACAGFAPLAPDAGAAANAYAAYLGARWNELDAELLPPVQRQVMRSADGAAALADVEDPYSRLVAAAVLFRVGRLSPAGIELAIDTAGREGWRRPLLAWLAVDRERRAAAGDVAGAEERQRRMDRVLAGGAPAR
jgi:hypothetical protein